MGKIKDENLKNIPIQFEKELKNYDNSDTRFTEVLIKVLHIGKNFNGSIFKKDVVENALPSMKNTPILAFIEENSKGEDDFSDHRIELESENGQTKLVYKCMPIGVIPESYVDNAYFEKCVCSDGVEREFLFVKGLMWNKLEKPLEIMNKNNGSGQSMELSDNYTGHFEDNGFVFDSFEFYGCTALGQDVKPAMIDSRIEVNFSASNIAKEVENKLKQFELVFSSNSQNDDKEVDEKDMAKKVEENVEEIKAEEVKDEFVEETVEEVQVEPQTEEFADDNKEDKEPKDDKEIKNDSTEEKDEDKQEDEKKTEKEYNLKFTLSHEDIRNKIYEKLNEMERNSDEMACYGIVKTMDNEFTYADFCNGKYYVQSYSLDENGITFNGERKEVFAVFVDENVLNSMKENSVSYYVQAEQELAQAKEQLEQYAKKNEELEDFKLHKDIDEVLSKFSQYEGLDLESFKKKAYAKEIKLEGLEDEIFKEIGKNNFSMKSKEPNKEVLNYTVALNGEEVCPYSSLKEYFK